MTVTLAPRILRWARERARLDRAALAKKVGTRENKVEAWEQTGKLRFAQLEKVAQATRTPVGFLFLAEPPSDELPIPDFRTVADAPVERPSPDLLETVETMQRRQAWMRDFLIEEGEPELTFVGSASLDSNPDAVSASMRETLGFSRGWANEEATWTDALLKLRQAIDAIGVLVSISGVVGNNNYRKLDPNEFRGFALIDSYAPLIFVNGSDAKAAQMFTMAHELAHVWVAEGGVSNLQALEATGNRVERFCNSAAAEFLVPEAEIRTRWPVARRADEPFQDLALQFKVSPLVAARRVLDLGLITREEFFAFYNEYLEDARRQQERQGAGGSFWNNQNVRLGQRFGAAVVRAAKEGRLLYREAYRLTGLSGPTFDKFAERLGFRLR
jgi:Zn-dependent peptidase ImmA (M78 family)/transcriptional regulator with XRE-family HTH domain